MMIAPVVPYGSCTSMPVAFYVALHSSDQGAHHMLHTPPHPRFIGAPFPGLLVVSTLFCSQTRLVRLHDPPHPPLLFSAPHILLVPAGDSLCIIHRSFQVPRHMPYALPSAGGARREEEMRPVFWQQRPCAYLQRTRAWTSYPAGRCVHIHKAVFVVCQALCAEQ